MPGVAYVNGQYVPHETASVHIEDRGFQFADGIYEVWYVSRGHLFDFEDHMTRLKVSLQEIGMGMPMCEFALKTHIQRVVRKNRIKDGLVYLQVTRGSAPRDHAFPDPGTSQTVVITAKPVALATINKKAETGVSVITHPDERWARCDIKSVSLLPNALAKQAAREQGAAEAWLVDKDGYVVEGSSSTAWIVEQTDDGRTRLRTRRLSHKILRGVTRTHLVSLLAAEGLELEEGPFTPEEALAAKEAFITSATNFVMPVVALDGQIIGNGEPGIVTMKLRALYLAEETGQ